MSKICRCHVIIVNFRTPELTIRCVESLIKYKIAEAEDITIVENCSGDDSVDRIRHALPYVKVIVSPFNGGFGSGINLGALGISAKYFLILNPDTYFELDSVTPVLDRLDAMHDVGLAGLDLVNPDGSRQFGARRFYSVLDIAARRLRGVRNLMRMRVDRHLMTRETSSGKPFDADWVLGTGFIVRRDVFVAIGGMEEAYFLYMEDVDLCARIWMAGFRVVYFPGFPLVHDHQRQSAASPFSFAGRSHLRSLLLFARRYGLPLVKSPSVAKIVRTGSARSRQFESAH